MRSALTDAVQDVQDNLVIAVLVIISLAAVGLMAFAVWSARRRIRGPRYQKDVTNELHLPTCPARYGVIDFDCGCPGAMYGKADPEQLKREADDR